MPTFTGTAVVTDAAGHATSVSAPFTVASPSTFPNATNTGVPAGTTLTVQGGFSANTAGAIYDARHFQGGVTVNANDVTFRRCKFSSGDFNRVRSLGLRLLLEDCEIDGLNTFGHGVSYRNFTLRRCYIHNVENGASIDLGGNCLIEDCFITGLYGGGDAHSDGVQLSQGAHDITFRHNTIQGGNTSAIIMWNEASPQNYNVLMDNNLFSGGSYTLYGPRQTGGTNIRIVNNRFVWGTWANGYANSCYPPYITEWNNNVRHDTGAQLAPA